MTFDSHVLLRPELGSYYFGARLLLSVVLLRTILLSPSSDGGLQQHRLLPITLVMPLLELERRILHLVYREGFDRISSGASWANAVGWV